MPETPEPLPQVIPERGATPKEADGADPIPLIDPSLKPVVGFRLLHRHLHSVDAEEVIICTLCQGADAGDSVGKTLATLNGFVRKGFKVVSKFQRNMGETQIMVLVLATGA
jgi:hypothetical protein